MQTKPKFSVALPSGTEGLCYPIPFTSLDVIQRMAKLAEELGYHSVWANDHLTTQGYVRDFWDSPPNYYDPLICLTYAATVTNRVKLGTSIVVLPMRDPVTLAKTVATLDKFTNGRMILGVGVGAYREEFEAVRPRLSEAGAHRGNMVTEGIQALRALFTEHDANFDGEYWAFRNVEMYPKPVQEPFPIWVGGNSDAGARRTGRLAEGWLSAVMPPEHIREKVAIIREEAEAAGRDAAAIEIAPQFIAQLGKTDEAATSTFRESMLYHHLLSLKDSTLKGQDLSKVEEFNLVGTPNTVVEKIHRYMDAGVTHFCALGFSTNTVEETLEQIQWFAEEVVPTV